MLCSDEAGLSHRVTCYVGHDAVFVEAALALGVLIALLTHRPLAARLRWVILAGLMAILSFSLAWLGSALYFLPSVGHTGPITPDTPNSFPSHHVLLAAVIAAAIFLLSPLWSVPFVVLAGVSNWGVVAARMHHPTDAAASDAFVAIATVAAVLLGRAVTPRLLRREEGPPHEEGINGRGIDRVPGPLGER